MPKVAIPALALQVAEATFALSAIPLAEVGALQCRQSTTDSNFRKSPIMVSLIAGAPHLIASGAELAENRHDELAAILHVELSEHAAEVRPDRVNADPYRSGNLLVAHAGHKKVADPHVLR